MWNSPFSINTFRQWYQPTRDPAISNVWFDIVLTNAGPYTARNVAVDLEWIEGILVRGSSATQGMLETNRWSISEINDGSAATLRVDTVLWTGASHWGTNRAVIVASDKPDGSSSNNTSDLPIFLPATTSTLIQLW